MQDFEKDLAKERRNIKEIFKYFSGVDISHKKKHWDIRIEGQMKTWLRNEYLPLETWSVIENNKKGWALDPKIKEVSCIFRCPEKKESLVIRGDEIYKFMIAHRMETKEVIKCRHCGKAFYLSKFEGYGIRRQTLQSTSKKEIASCDYHSAMIEVDRRVFPHEYMKEYEPSLILT